MGRTKEGLIKGLGLLKELRKTFYQELRIPGSKEGVNVELEKALRLEDFILMGELMANDALHREESCGGHFREEHQTEEGEAKRDDENFFLRGLLGNTKAATTVASRSSLKSLSNTKSLRCKLVTTRRNLTKRNRIFGMSRS